MSGNHACITVNTEPPSKEDYWKFLERAREHGMEFDDLLAALRPGEEAAEPEESNDSNPVLGLAKMLGKTIGGLPPMARTASTRPSSSIRRRTRSATSATGTL